MLKNCYGHVEDDILAWSVRSVLNTDATIELYSHLVKCAFCRDRLLNMRDLISQGDRSLVEQAFVIAFDSQKNIFRKKHQLYN